MTKTEMQPDKCPHCGTEDCHSMWLGNELVTSGTFRERALRAALEVAIDAMCQATFIVRGQKSDLNYAIDKARKALGVK